MKSVGAQLRDGRKALGWTLKAASKATKIREDQLQKLEADDFARFHASTYVKGFVRNYASVLGLNVRQVTEDLDRVLETEGEVTYHRFGGINYVPELAKTQRKFSLRGAALGVCVLLFVGLIVVGGWQFYRVAFFMSDSNSSSFSQSPPSAASKADAASLKTDSSLTVKKAEGVPPAAEPPAGSLPKALPAEPVVAPPVATADSGSTTSSVPVPPPAVPENKLAMMAKEECWVRVSVLDNNQPKTIFEDILPAGKTQEFPPAAKYLVKLSIPAAIEISLNGKTYPTNHSDERVPVEFSVPAGETN